MWLLQRLNRQPHLKTGNFTVHRVIQSLPPAIEEAVCLLSSELIRLQSWSCESHRGAVVLGFELVEAFDFCFAHLGTIAL